MGRPIFIAGAAMHNPGSTDARSTSIADPTIRQRGGEAGSGRFKITTRHARRRSSDDLGLWTPLGGGYFTVKLTE